MTASFSQRTLLVKLFPLLVILIYLTLMIARFLYPADAPEPYSDIWETISGLGDMEDNPIGFIFFQISMTLMGVMPFLTLIYVHPKLIEISAKKANIKIGSFWLLMAGIGFLLTGLIPDGVIVIPEWDKFHEITSGLGTLGLVFAAFFYFDPCKRAGNQIKRPLLWVITLVWWIPLVVFGVFYALAELMVKEVWYASCDLGWYGPEWGECGVPWIYSFSVWERIIFTILIIYQVLLVAMIPEKK